MGNLLSMSSEPPAERKRILGAADNTKSPITTNTEPLFLDEGEILKKEQQYPLFKKRITVSVFNVGNRVGAIIIIQRLYRRYRRLRIWHEVSDNMLLIARGQLETLRAQEQTNISAASFRQLLVEGFSASKVCISGALKTVQLRLVLNPEAGECYLTWTPSRKKKPRINLHDIEEVIAVRKEGNPEAPRLSKKVSYRRGVILVCKSYHRGRVVLEVATKRERNILLQGFQQLLSEMASTEPTLDVLGALRNQQPRRQSVMEFFSTTEESQVPAVIIVPDVSSLMPRRGSIAVYRPEALGEDTPSLSEDSRKVPVQDQEAHEMADSVRADAKAIEHFYQTRFDDSPDSARPSRAMEARH
ncbi:hypothetical protein PPTG_15953 [Phytophthora nicotianae INRA-310]|uniref:Uncharacterized protein n=1 Tax=Phytophthora nicotianae (strain INRA-310) TaxID=761204 RepID=W2PU58_PHYN3|nr:hypothetical protein PPTG_15953 [Phytophthora nicotianae INRA-310]ETN03749.1 hypothetical protein PPTG_15953 [Phytophthora nicotianae INRA-310]